MSAHPAVHQPVHAPVGGPLMTPGFKVLLATAAVGMLVILYRFIAGLGAASNLNDGYPWGIWIAIDVVTGTALGCGGFAIAILVYILNRGQYHPLVRPAVLTSLLGYGFAAFAVVLDLGRFWELWKVPLFFWRWTHSPQLEVALCVLAYVIVLAVELSPAFMEKWRVSANATLRALSERGLGLMQRGLVWVLALGLLLPTMHQSSLGTMMLLPGPRVHPLWFTPWLPFLFLIGCIGMGYAIVVFESHFSAMAFKRPAETPMLASLSKVAAGVAVFWAVFRLAEVVVAGESLAIATPRGPWFVAEVLLHLVGAWILWSKRRRRSPMWQIRAAIVLIVAGSLFRINTYLVAFMPGAEWSYFPSLPEIFATLGIIALEVVLYVAAVKTFPILAGVRRPAERGARP